MIKDYLDEKLHEECGVFGVYRRDADLDVVGTTYYGLYALQHRGQESCGMAVNDDGVFYKRRELGLVNDVFTKDVLETMPRGNMCIGHCRYATTGVPVRSNAQPFVIRHIKGPMALAHNGNLTNSAELRSEFELSGAIFHSTSDTEVIAYAITRERLSSDSIEQAVEQTMDRLKGAYSLVVMSPRKLIAARDPQGFRPLCIGKLGENDIIASESCAITAAGGEFVRDVEPGEIVVFDENGCRSIRTHCGCPTGLCVFEYVYIARPDSVVDGASVHRARRRAGAFLALVVQFHRVDHVLVQYGVLRIDLVDALQQAVGFDVVALLAVEVDLTPPQPPPVGIHLQQFVDETDGAGVVLRDVLDIDQQLFGLDVVVIDIDGLEQVVARLVVVLRIEPVFSQQELQVRGKRILLHTFVEQPLALFPLFFGEIALHLLGILLRRHVPRGNVQGSQD